MNSTCNSLLVLTLVVASAHALSLFGQKRRMESVVRKYFDGVNKKDPDQIRSCFGEEAVIRDVVVSDAKRTVKSQILADRCMDFLTAHPDCKVDFYYGPECGRNSNWVVAHWWEVGTWSGESCGLTPSNAPMACEGQTRFFVKDGKIQEFVVTRTVTEWEKAFLEKQKQEAK